MGGPIILSHREGRVATGLPLLLPVILAAAFQIESQAR